MDGIQYSADRDLLLNITGDRSKAIRLINTNDKKARKSIEFDGNASSKVLSRN